MLDIPRSAPAVLPESGVTLEPKKPEPEAVLIPPMKKKSVVKKRKVKVLVSEIKPDTLPKVQTESLAKTEQSPLPILSAISKPRKKTFQKRLKTSAGNGGLAHPLPQQSVFVASHAQSQ